MDDNDSDPADAPLLATPGAFETLYVPDFVDDHDPDNPQSKKELEEGNWVTFGLELELKECSRSAHPLVWTFPSTVTTVVTLNRSKLRLHACSLLDESLPVPSNWNRSAVGLPMPGHFR
jgi:hypothetical protein